MLRLTILKQTFSLTPYLKSITRFGIKPDRLVFNPTVPQLYQIAFLTQPPSDPFTRPSFVASNGALCAYSGLKTGRQPQNSRVVKDAITNQTVNWGKTNIAIAEPQFQLIEKMAIDFINHKKRCIVVDGYAGWDQQNQIKVRTFCTRTYHALFMRNMLRRPTQKELEEDFTSGADINIFNGGQMNVSPNIEGLTSSMVTTLNLTQQKMVIMGTQFAGEMKKSIFKILHYIFPRRGILTLHCAANMNKNGTSTLMCGLSATGKTALGLRSDHRKIIGDDEICWGDNGVFNIEGGVYAKINYLKKEAEPEIFNSIKFGSIVQNASFSEGTRNINFSDVSITPNARTSFPLHYLPNAQLPAVGPHPKNVIFLTCDTKGVLPPISKLTKEQAIYQFLSGYTAKIGGTDLTSKTPQSTFSACFGQIFLPLDPTIYAKMLLEKIQKHNVSVWLVNTGWINGRYGVGKRIQFADSLAIIDAINQGKIDNVPTYKSKFFNFSVPNEVPGIDPKLLHPENNWHSKIEYEEELTALAVQFINNYEKKYQGKINQQIDAAGPKLF